MVMDVEEEGVVTLSSVQPKIGDRPDGEPERPRTAVKRA